MPYQSGKKLTKRLVQAGLEELIITFANFKQEDNWTQPIIIETAEGVDAEYIRNLIYSLLHDFEIKDEFTVSMPKYKTLKIDRKFQPKKVTISWGLPSAQAE